MKTECYKCGGEASSKEMPHVSGWIVSCDGTNGECGMAIAAVGATEREALDNWEALNNPNLISYELEEDKNGDSWKVEYSNGDVEFTHYDHDNDEENTFQVPVRVFLGFIEANLPEITTMILEDKDEDIANLEEQLGHQN